MLLESKILKTKGNNAFNISLLVVLFLFGLNRFFSLTEINLICDYGLIVGAILSWGNINIWAYIVRNFLDASLYSESYQTSKSLINVLMVFLKLFVLAFMFYMMSIFLPLAVLLGFSLHFIVGVLLLMKMTELPPNDRNT